MINTDQRSLSPIKGAVLQREGSQKLLHHVLDSLAHGSQHHQNSGPPDGMVGKMVRIHVDWLQFRRFQETSAIHLPLVFGWPNKLAYFSLAATGGVEVGA